MKLERISSKDCYSEIAQISPRESLTDHGIKMGMDRREDLISLFGDPEESKGSSGNHSWCLKSDEGVLYSIHNHIGSDGTVYRVSSTSVQTWVEQRTRLLPSEKGMKQDAELVTWIEAAITT